MPKAKQRRKIRRRTYTVAEVAAILGVGMNSAYAGVNNGSIPSIKIGNRRLVPEAALRKMLAGDELS